MCNSLHRITIALREIDDLDYEWRVFLEKTLIEAYLDNKQLVEASKLANELLGFVEKKCVASMGVSFYDELFEFMVRHDLIGQDTELMAKLISGVNARWELQAIYRIEKLKVFKPSEKDDVASRITRQITSMSLQSAKSGALDGDGSGDAGGVTDAKYIYNELDEIYRIILPMNLHNNNSQFMRANSDDFVVTQKR